MKMKQGFDQRKVPSSSKLRFGISSEAGRLHDGVGIRLWRSQRSGFDQPFTAEGRKDERSEVFVRAPSNTRVPTARKRLGQSGTELLALVSFLLFIFAGVYVSFLKNDISAAQKEMELKANDIGKLVAFEISSAVQVGHGYERNFTIPNTINGMHYSISLDSGFVVINTSQNSFFIPTVADTVAGTFVEGANTIRNTNGTIYANPT